jgi:hypothetical protein
MLQRTLVVVATEFGRTIAAQPAAGTEPDGFAETVHRRGLTIDNEKMYGFHGHFSSCNSMLFFGGGFKKGFAYGKTADHHPMIRDRERRNLSDVHATIYKALGIPADTNYVTEGRPFYVTNNGKGKAIEGAAGLTLLATSPSGRGDKTKMHYGKTSFFSSSRSRLPHSPRPSASPTRSNHPRDALRGVSFRRRGRRGLRRHDVRELLKKGDKAGLGVVPGKRSESAIIQYLEGTRKPACRRRSRR